MYSGASVCPIDNILSLDEDVRPDRAIQRDLSKLIAECPATGCNWKDLLMVLEVRNSELHTIMTDYM